MKRAALAGAALWLLAGPAAAAQDDAPRRFHRRGLWGEISAGIGRLRMGCATLGSDNPAGTFAPCTEPLSAPGTGGVVRIGGTLTRRVLLGVESAGFIDETFGVATENVSTVAEIESVGVVVLWFPGRTGAFFKGGVGIAHGRFTIPTGPAAADTARGTGIGMTFGLGWDVPISRKLALTANGATYIVAIGDIRYPGGRVDDVIGSLVQLTFGLTFR